MNRKKAKKRLAPVDRAGINEERAKQGLESLEEEQARYETLQKDFPDTKFIPVSKEFGKYRKPLET